MKAVSEIFDRHSVNGQVRMDYTTQICFGRLEES